MKNKIDELHIEKIKLSQLKLDLNNLRGHNDSEIELIIRSLTIFGQFKPLIVDKNTMTVKIGNGRLMAMRKMGWTEADCILLDWNDNKKGMEVIDNRLNELGTWNDASINKWFKDKGTDWWGLDEETSSKVEKIIKKQEKKKQKKSNQIQQKKDDEIIVKKEHLCPCCGKPLIKKDRLIID